MVLWISFVFRSFLHFLVSRFEVAVNLESGLFFDDDWDCTVLDASKLDGFTCCGGFISTAAASAARAASGLKRGCLSWGNADLDLDISVCPPCCAERDRLRKLLRVLGTLVSASACMVDEAFPFKLSVIIVILFIWSSKYVCISFSASLVSTTRVPSVVLDSILSPMTGFPCMLLDKLTRRRWLAGALLDSSFIASTHKTSLPYRWMWSLWGSVISYLSLEKIYLLMLQSVARNKQCLVPAAFLLSPFSLHFDSYLRLNWWVIWSGSQENSVFYFVQ